jgi:hypothetical protein
LAGEALLEPFALRCPNQANRLWNALEAFLTEGNVMATELVSNNAGQSVRMVPQRYLLQNNPDAAALLLVDDVQRRIELKRIIDDYGGPDAGVWRQLEQEATAWLA